MNNGLLLGLGALVVGGGIAWLAFNDDTDNSIDSRDWILNNWAVSNNLCVAVPNDRTISPRSSQPETFLINLLGNCEPGAALASLVYFPATDSLHVNADGFPVDNMATQSWRAFQAKDALINATSLVGSPRDASTPNGSILLNFEPI